MNLNALVISLNSVIQAGKKINEGRVDEMFLREYHDLYMKTKEHLKSLVSEYPSLETFITKLPNIEYKKFDNPLYLFKTFLLE